jgi:hypothetical protein
MKDVVHKPLALNYAERRRNMQQGQWFVNNILHEDISNIDTLKEKLMENDTKFIQKLQYFAQCVPGSDAYWRNKKAELVSWIGHHVEEGNGAPSLFLTLSCAEYHWKDIEILLNKRKHIAGELPIKLDNITDKVKAVNDYSLIIQEYFQTRVKDFLENYARDVFGINHYYARFEFAKSRGQIHVHLLAMLGQKSKIKELNQLVYEERQDPVKQAKVADEYLIEAYGLTAIHPGSWSDGTLRTRLISKPEGTCEKPDTHPSGQKLCDVTNYMADMCLLCNNCQMHGCSGYCLYHQKKKKNKMEPGLNGSTTMPLSGIKKRQCSAGNNVKSEGAKRFCRFGAGKEVTIGKGDTPGFDLQDSPTISVEGHGFTKHLVYRSPRNTNRMVQTSMYLAQVWRGNVDVKPLLYQTDPSHPDPEDIVTCSDYLVGYQMKGAQTLAIERKNMKDLVMNMEDIDGDKKGVYSAARKLLNRASVDRTISKQEAMCLLGQLPLTICSERIEPVSLSPLRRMVNTCESEDSEEKKTKTWIDRYAKREGNQDMSFHSFVCHGLEEKRATKSKTTIPHYTGSIQYCSFPLQENYCQQVLLAYKPWSHSCRPTNRNGKSYKAQFLDFIKTAQCSQSILLSYERAKRRKQQEDKGVFKHEPTSNVDFNQELDIEIDGLDKDEADALNMMCLHGSNVPDDTWNLDRGYDYDWSQPTFERKAHLWKTAATHLCDALEGVKNITQKTDIPMRAVDGEVIHYDIDNATESQGKVLYRVFAKVKEWVEWDESDKSTEFKPLRLTVRGAAGTGKSFIINTMVSYLRRMFDDSDVVHVIAPTGMAAFNVLGETLHRFAGIDWKNLEKGVSGPTKERLRKKLQNTIAILLDERSMVSQKMLGLVERSVAQTAHECGHSDEDWGGIPVVVLFGDDYQLPAISADGATKIPQIYRNSARTKDDPIEDQGALQFMNLSENVLELDKVVRQQDNQVFFKELLGRLRVGWVTKEDEERLRALTLDDDNYSQKQIKELSDGALHVFSRHVDKDAFNEQKLRATVTADNPLAIIKCLDETAGDNKKMRGHLNKTFDMRKTMLCRDAMVEITKANIEPKWGLYNGALGTVIDIIYKKGENPNNGDLPHVVVVDFKHYRGPIWDEDNPTHVPIVPVKRRCDPMCCSRQQIPLQLAWAKTVHSLQGHNAGPTGKNQTVNSIQRLVIHLGDRINETLNPGLSYVAISRGTTLGDCGSHHQIPEMCLNSAIYFRSGSFPKNIQCLTHSPLTKKEYVKVKERSAWVAYLDKKQHNTSTISKESAKMEIKTWLDTTKYTRDELLNVVRRIGWRKRKAFIIPKKKPVTCRAKNNHALLLKTHVSGTSLLHSGEMMPGYHIEDYLKIVLQHGSNLSFMATHFGPGLCNEGEVLWDRLIDASNDNYVKRAQAMKDTPNSIILIPWFSGKTKSGHWSLVIRLKSTKGKVTFYHFDSLNHQTETAKCALSKTPLYNESTHKWQNIRTERQTELECGMRVCLAASMICQYQGSIQKRVAMCKVIPNLSQFARQHVVETLSSRTWTPFSL